MKTRVSQRQTGLSLIELLAALSIGAVLSFGVANLFLQSKRSHFQDEETARLQENGRWALRYLSRELSMAGFFGGMLSGDGISTALVVAPDCGVGWALDTSAPLEHLNDATPTTAAAAYSCLTGADVLPGTDIVAVRRVKDSPHVFDGEVNAGTSDKTVYLRIEEYGADASLVLATSAAITTADTTAGSEVDVWEYRPQLLFVRDYSVTDGDGIPALCRRLLTTSTATLAMAATQCLVEGVENLQLEYGIDDGTPLDYVPDYYTSAPTAAELSSAVTARIYLLSRSAKEVAGYTNDKSYQLGTKTVAATNDGFYRRVLETTVMLRNSELFGF